MHPVINVKLDEGAHMPERAHGTDAGADIRTPRAFTIAGHGHAIIETGVHVETPPNCAAMLKERVQGLPSDCGYYEMRDAVLALKSDLASGNL